MGKRKRDFRKFFSGEATSLVRRDSVILFETLSAPNTQGNVIENERKRPNLNFASTASQSQLTNTDFESILSYFDDEKKKLTYSEHSDLFSSPSFIFESSQIADNIKNVKAGPERSQINRNMEEVVDYFSQRSEGKDPMFGIPGSVSSSFSFSNTINKGESLSLGSKLSFNYELNNTMDNPILISEVFANLDDYLPYNMPDSLNTPTNDSHTHYNKPNGFKSTPNDEFNKSKTLSPNRQFNEKNIPIKELDDLLDETYTSGKENSSDSNVFDKKEELIEKNEELISQLNNLHHDNNTNYSRSFIVTPTFENNIHYAEMNENLLNSSQISEINDLELNNNQQQDRSISNQLFKHPTTDTAFNYDIETKKKCEALILNAALSFDSTKSFVTVLKEKIENHPPNINVEEGCDVIEFPTNCPTPQEKLVKGIESLYMNPKLIFLGTVKKSDEKLIKEEAKMKILNIFQNLCDRVESNNGLYLFLRSTIPANFIFKDSKLLLKHPTCANYRIIQGVGRSSDNFQYIVFVLAKMYSLLSANTTCNQREIYYQNVASTCGSMQRLTDAINTASILLNIPPWYLGITTTNKGLIYGNLIIMFSYHQIIQCNAPEGTLIPSDLDNIQYVQSTAAFILIVEKDAIFQKLLQEDVPNKLAKPFILITGKGFPDLNTRRMIIKLWQMLKIPVFVLVDADPSGIEIMLTYRFGSMKWAHLNEDLALPNLRWLGILPSEIIVQNIKSASLTKIDRNKLNAILNRPYMPHCKKIRQEIKTMLECGLKAEIEGIMKNDNFLTNVYLPNKFYSRDFK